MSTTVVGPFTGFYQVAYVTNDFNRAMDLFRDTHGINRFMENRDIRYQTGPGREAVCHIGLAYMGATEIELIEPRDGDVQLYRDYLPEEAFGLRFHHICKLFRDDEAFDRQVGDYRKEGRRLPLIGSSPGFARYFCADFRAELGHYIEGIVFADAARPWLDSIPRN